MYEVTFGEIRDEKVYYISYNGVVYYIVKGTIHDVREYFPEVVR